MKKIFSICVFWGLVTTGCMPTQPVSSVKDTDVTKDSTNVRSASTKRDSSYVETVTPINIPAGKVDLGFTKKQFDSLVTVLSSLKALPSEVRTIYKIDPTTHQKLRIFMDSVGNIHFQCLQDAQVYWQKFIHERTEREKLQSQLTQASTKLKSQDNELSEARKSWSQRIKDSMRHWGVKFLIYLIIVGIGVACVEFGLGYVKRLNFISVILKFLKLKK